MPHRDLKLGADRFAAAAQRVVDYLNGHTPLADWSVTRVAGGQQVCVHVHGDRLVDIGSSSDWSDTFCVRMVNGAAPVVPDTLADPDYADHPIAGTVRSYAGAPLTDDTGELFGVLCGFGTEPLDSVEDVDLDLVRLLGDLLSSQLITARTADREWRSSRIAEALAHTDPLTGLTNRRGWDELVLDAQQRIDAYGDLVAVAVIDLDGLKHVNDTEGHPAGDRLIRRAATTLSGAASGADRVARYGGDEFGVLANSVGPRGMEQHFARYSQALDAAGIPGSIGYAATQPGVATVVQAFAEADRAMYAAKTTHTPDSTHPGAP